MSRLAIVIVSFLAVLISDGSAATIQSAKGVGGRTEIQISGEILRGDDERFATVAGSAPEDVEVALESPGGNLVTGLRIGSAIRMRAWKTIVPDGATCASSTVGCWGVSSSWRTLE